MITGGHIIVYSTNAEADRAFIKDVLKFKYVDVNRGWLIFKLPPSELAVHPLPDAGPRPQLEQGLGPQWTPEVRAAWRSAYSLLAGVMREAAREPHRIDSLMWGKKLPCHVGWEDH